MFQWLRWMPMATVTLVQRFRATPIDTQPVTQLMGSLRTAQAELADRQRQLETSERRLSLALAATGDGIWDYRQDKGAYFSDTYYRMLGYPPGCSQLQPEHWFKLVHPDDAAEVQEAMRRVRCEEDDILAVEFRILTASKQWKWVFLRGQVIDRDERRVPQRMIGTVQDIDGRRQAEAAMLENQELFRNAFVESPVGMAMVRPDGRMMRVNGPMCEITGYSESELLERTFEDITHPDDVAADVEFFKSMLKGERRHYDMEKRYIRKDGAVVWIALNVGVVLDADQKLRYVIGHVQDITERKCSEAELKAYSQRLCQTMEELERRSSELVSKTAEAEAAMVAAEDAAQAKSAFLANISHEIRTPMAAIIGFANLLLDGRLPEDERTRCTQTIARQGQHLLALINDILDLSKIEAGKMTVEYIDCDPAQVLADVEAMTAARAMDKRLPLILTVASDVPRRVRTDPTRLRQVLLNLVSNAIKFTSTGEIRVGLAKSTTPGAAGLSFVVSDTGIGMDEQQVDRLFEPFTQADASTTRRFGGTGLGLAISKRLVEMMRGTLTVESKVGRGSTFRVTIEAPVCQPAPMKNRLPPPVLRNGLRVLLAEDGPDNQRLIMFYLQHSGIAVDVAENGRIAVEMASRAVAAGHPYDLVLMDMQMPEMDGCEAALALRRAGIVVPVVALTAHGSEDARLQSLQAGCREHLVKPVDHDDLMTAIATHTSGGRTPAMRPQNTLADDPRFKALQAQYVAELPGQACELRHLTDDGNRPERLRRLLHQVKGAAGGYGLTELSVAAADAVHAFDRGEVNSVNENVDNLLTLMRSVQGYDRDRECSSCNSGC